MRLIEDPSVILSGVTLVAAPHMDDEVLACGGTMCLLPRKERVHVAYATDGARSPLPALAGRRARSAELPEIRMREARAAMSELGVPRENLHFLGLPDSELRRHIAPLTERLQDLLCRIEPDHVLVPFRYDRHPDHLTLARTTRRAVARARPGATIYEYFVYYRWRLLPSGDVRDYVAPEHMVGVDFSRVAERKRAALRCYTSQTTRFYDWQDRPIVTEEQIDDVCGTPEWFLGYDAGHPGAAIFPRRRAWIRIVHASEPRLKSWKEAGRAVWRGSSR